MSHPPETIDIHATPQQVWSVLTDLSRLPEWYVPAQRITLLTEGPVREGWQFRLAVKTLPGIVLNALGTVKLFDPQTYQITWHGKTLGIRGDSVWRIHEIVGGRAQLSHSFHASGWLYLLSDKSGRNAQTLRRRLANLKGLVEQTL